MASSTTAPINIESGLLKDVEFQHDTKQRTVAGLCRTSTYLDEPDDMAGRSEEMSNPYLSPDSLIQTPPLEASTNEDGYGDEPQDSGRTRSSTRKANQAVRADTNTRSKTDTKGNQSKEERGEKRKKKNANGEDDSDSESEGNRKRKPPLEEAKEAVESTCSCPKNVMTCIGILPSLPIINHLYDSDDSLSSANEDLNFTVLPIVNRNKDHGS